MPYIIEENGKKEIVICTTLIVDGHLSEFSLVYDGALEGAAIVEKSLAKAQRLHDTKQLTTEHKDLLNTRHQIRFKSGKAIYDGQTPPVDSKPMAFKVLDEPKSDDKLILNKTKTTDPNNGSADNLSKEPTKMNKEERLQQELDELKSDIKDLKEVNAKLKAENEDVVALKVELES